MACTPSGSGFGFTFSKKKSLFLYDLYQMFLWRHLTFFTAILLSFKTQICLLSCVGFFWTISVSQPCSQRLQNTEIIKQTALSLWKIWRKYRSVSSIFIYLHDFEYYSIPLGFFSKTLDLEVYVNNISFFGTMSLKNAGHVVT